MSEPTRAGNAPIPVDVVAGTSYYWCSCGRSKKQPFCDGSHAGTEFTPVEFKATESKKLFFCSCKATRKVPFCDGSHSK